MALPNHYKNKKNYFTDALDFLNKHAWIFQHSNTAFVKADIFEKCPDEFKLYFSTITNEELNEFPLMHFNAQTTGDTQSLLNEFRVELKALIPTQAFAEVSPEDLPANVKFKFQKMNLKKQHEIRKLARLINEICKDDIDLLIDFGAGLGYLSEMIFTLSNNKFLLLGLEAEATRVEAATKRQKLFMPEMSRKCLYKQQFINENSCLFLNQSIAELVEQNKLPTPTQTPTEIPKAAIIGLHACADLTITGIKLFFEMGSNMKKLIIMPCCYHKLEFNAETKTFRNFPLSHVFKNVLENYENSSNYLNRPFLRLACQQTLARWRLMSAKDHRKHGLDMLRRGIAEAIVNEDVEFVVKRKIVKEEDELKNDCGAFFEFCQLYQLRCKTSKVVLPWSKAHEFKFNALTQKFGFEGYKLAEGLTCLQTALQKLCENIVLYDRLCFMEEYASANNLKVNVRYEKLLDEKLSPRCYVLIAEKL